MHKIQYVLLIMVLFCSEADAQRYKVQHAFSLHEKIAVVEGMAYDSVAGNFYFGDNVSLKILRYTKTGTPAGNIDVAKDGMTSLLGITVAAKQRQLWICGSILKDNKKTMCLFQYSLPEGKFISYFPDTSGKPSMFNDVAVTENGGVFTTDPDTRSVYRVDFKSGIAVLYIKSDSLRYANGITANGNDIFVSTVSGFGRINTIDGTLSVVRFERYLILGNDGIYYYDNSIVGIQNVAFPVTIARYFLTDNDSKIKNGVILATEHSLFDIPTTGAIVGNEFYFMSNTNISYFDFEEHKVITPEKIKPIRVMKISLIQKQRG